MDLKCTINRIARQPKHLRQQALSLFVALLLCASQFPLSAYAYSGSYSEDDGCALAAEEIQVEDDAVLDESEVGDSPVTSDDTSSEVSTSDEAPDSGEASSAEDDEFGSFVESASSSANSESDGDKLDAGEDVVAALAAADSVAPVSSSVELEAGTYTVSANVSMLTPLGITAYATNPQNPLGIGESGIPGAPVKNNAELVVDADGRKTLTFELVNPVFTVQDFSDGEGVSVVSKERVDIEEDPTDPSYIKDIHEDGFYTRVSKVVVSLDNWDGSYEFSNCSEYATALNRNESLSYGRFNIPLTLTVDFANAIRHVDGDFSKTFFDENSGIKLSVEAESSSSVIDELQTAELKVSSVGDAEKSAIDIALGQKFKVNPTFEGYKISLVSGDSEIAFDDKVKLTLGVADKCDSLYLYDDGVLSSISIAPSDGFQTAEVSKLGTFAVIQSGNSSQWEWSKTLTDDTTGASITYSTDTYWDDIVLNGGELGQGAEALNIYADYMGASAKKITDADSLASYTGQLNFDGMRNPQVDAVWGIALNLMGGADYPSGYDCPIGNGHSKMSATFPVDAAKTSFYLVSGKVGSSKTVKKVASSASKGFVTFDLVPADMENGSTLPFWNYVMNCDRWPSAQQTDDTEIAFIVAVSEASEKVAKPTASSELVYNGENQTGIPSSEAYTVNGVGEAVNAGSYSAIVTLNEGYVWDDGSSDSIVLNWSISSKRLRAAYVGDSDVKSASEVKLAVEVSGFVNGESVDTIEGYQAPEVRIPDSLKAGSAYSLTPEGGNAGSNYVFEYVAGVLSLSADFIPDYFEAGTYSVTANIYCPASENDILHLTAYMTNPKNPLVSEDDPDYGVPTTPMSNNATLVVSPDGSKHLIVDLPNPAFTLMKIGLPSNGAVLAGVARDASVYGNHVSGRITQVVFDISSCESSYSLAGSGVYAAPLKADKKWNLQLGVSWGSMKKISDSTDYVVPDDSNDENHNNGGGSNSGNSGDNNQNNNSGNNGSNNGASGNGGSVSTTTDGHLAAGTYTVSGNVWLPKSQTGLPLNPHLSNGGFPPSSPVASNATLVVDGTGHAYVRIPVTIQDKVMVVNNVWGPGVSFDGSTITIDLGTPSAGQTTFTGTCQASVTIGWLAQTIAAGIFNGVWDHTWTANWEVDLGSVLPASGGGTLPAAAQAILNGANGVAAQESAAEAALAALDEGGSSASESAAAKKAGSQAASDEGGAADGGMAPVTVACIALGAVAVAAIAAWLLLSRRKRNAAAEAGADSANGE